MIRSIFLKQDDDILQYLLDDGMSIQPKWYVPIIPMVLVNGAEGIGTGWSTCIPNYNPLSIVNNLLGMLDGEKPRKMTPWYMGFNGKIQSIDSEDESILTTGVYSANKEQGTIEISELPLGKWTDDYKEFLKKAMVPSGPDTPALIPDYFDRTTDTRVNITIYVDSEQMQRLQLQGIAESLKLTTKLSTANMVLLSHDGRIKRYANVTDILSEFFRVRMAYYIKRKASIVSVSVALLYAAFGRVCVQNAEQLINVLENEARFITAVAEGKLALTNRKKKDVIKDMEQMKFDKQLLDYKKTHQTETAVDDVFEVETTAEDVTRKATFNYLLKMPMDHLTFEKIEELRQKTEKLKMCVHEISARSPEDMWREDLRKFRTVNRHLLFSSGLVCVRHIRSSGRNT